MPKPEKTKQATVENDCQQGDFYGAFQVANGNYVMKYSMGNAVMMLPFFFVGHWWALHNGYKVDGFSIPYQFFISLGCLIYTLLSLFFLRKILLRFFNDNTTAICLTLIVLATNYLEYAAISGGMTHNQLFFVYTLILYFTIRFYETPKTVFAVLIGGLIGLAVLIRPTEIILLVIPLLWNVSSLTALRERIKFIAINFSKVFILSISMIAVISLQLIYWKWVSGNWLVYSYGDQHFDWLKPHIYLGLFSVKKGWYVYTPVMFLATIGFYFLWKKNKNVFVPTIIFMLLTVYFVFAWSIWWYSTSLGQRAMVQSCALMAFPLAALIEWILERKFVTKFLFGGIFLLCIYLNINFTWQAHYAPIFEGENMTKAFFWKTIGRWSFDKNDLRFLDTNEEFKGERKNVATVFENKDTIIVSPAIENSKPFVIDLKNKKIGWIRVSANFFTYQKEWTVWQMPQLIVRFKNNDAEIKSRFIRVSRLMEDDKKQHQIYFDVKIPTQEFTKCEVQLWNGNSTKTMRMEDVLVTTFD